MENESKAGKSYNCTKLAVANKTANELVVQEDTGSLQDKYSKSESHTELDTDSDVEETEDDRGSDGNHKNDEIVDEKGDNENDILL